MHSCCHRTVARLGCSSLGLITSTIVRVEGYSYPAVCTVLMIVALTPHCLLTACPLPDLLPISCTAYSLPHCPAYAQPAHRLLDAC